MRSTATSRRFACSCTGWGRRSSGDAAWRPGSAATRLQRQDDVGSSTWLAFERSGTPDDLIDIRFAVGQRLVTRRPPGSDAPTSRHDFIMMWRSGVIDPAA
jgi:hypothetical protein